ncbi:MAG TPA: hypothetical protein PKZ77_05070 [Pseudomonadales bacterium]|nr:hypothetical protein [Pseudomonadales bacterium]HNC69838.1 hypothetical protein [Pseudomonadales bacterium]HND14226.1 hypothetical protein [Pseudomonadales bacterium]
MKHPFVFTVTLLLAAAVLAQEPPAVVETAPAPGTASTGAAREAQRRPARDPEDDRFIPSENIEEDLSVSFPSDI